MIADLFPVAHPLPQLVQTPTGLAIHPYNVRVKEEATYWQVENNRTGFRVAKAPANPSLAGPPVIEIKMSNGSWVNTVGGAYPFHCDGPTHDHVPPDSVVVTFLEQTPERVKIKTRYDFTLPEGPLYHETIIELQADSDCPLFTEDGTADIAYTLNFLSHFQPTRAQYRGWASSAVQFGREITGIQYRPEHEREAMDAEIDLQYTIPVVAGFYAAENLITDWAYRRPLIATWNLNAVDTGRYWLMYDHTGLVTSPLVGLFAGRASELIGGSFAGATIVNGPGYVGIQVSITRASPSSYSPRNRFQWGLWTTTKASILPLDAYTQPIQQKMSLHSGLNLDKLGGMIASPVDLPGGYGATYLPATVTTRIRNKVRDEQAYYEWLLASEPSAVAWYDLWRATDLALAVNTLAATVIGEINGVIAEWVNGNGYQSTGYDYIRGSNRVTSLLEQIDELLASSHLTPGNRTILKAAASAFAYVLWDGDYVPLQKDVEGNLLFHGSLGTSNMPIQFDAQRGSFSIFMGANPAPWPARADQAGDSAVAALDGSINEHGAHESNVGYVFTATPNLLTLLRLKRLGDDRFNLPKLELFAEYVLQFLAPPDVRFGGRRKQVSFGDMKISGSSMPGVLATGFAGVNSVLASRLMGAWHSMDRRHDSFYGSSVFQIDDEAPQISPALASADFDGALTILRSGYGTSDECAIWVRQGNYGADHFHFDKGAVIASLLKAPIIQDWSSGHTPHVLGSIHHSGLILESMCSEPWDQDGIAFDAGSDWPTSARFVSDFDDGNDENVAITQGDGTVEWDRYVRLVQVGGKPVLSIMDTCTGSAPKLVTWNLMGAAQGITVPSATAPDEPLAGVVVPISGTNGVHKISFSGQWGVDFDVYICYDPAGSAPEARLSSWGHGAGEEGEKAEFLLATSQVWEERQQTLRLRSTAGQFQLVIVAYPTGQTPAVTISRRPDGVLVASVVATIETPL